MILFEETLPLHTVSPNLKEHWSKRHRRDKKNADIIKKVWLFEKPVIPLPCLIVLTRISAGFLDVVDNLPGSQKHIIDTIAGLLIPGLQPGRADGDPRLKFQFEQQKGKMKEHFVKIQIMSA